MIMVRTIPSMPKLFMDAPKTRKAFDLKEEVTLNTIEKYQDLVSFSHIDQQAGGRNADDNGQDHSQHAKVHFLRPSLPSGTACTKNRIQETIL